MNSTELKNYINQYIESSAEIMSKYKPLAGLFGFGKGPKDDECHMQFFETIENTTFDVDDAYECVRTLLFADRDFQCCELNKGFLTVISQFAIPLISHISPDQKTQLLDEYCSYVPKHERLPIQKAIVNALND